MVGPRLPPQSNATPASVIDADSNARLQQALLDLVLTCRGRHPTLDKHIQRLEALKNSGANKSRIVVILGRAAEIILAQSLLSVDQAATTRKLAELLDKRPLSADFAEKARFLRNRLRAATTPKETDSALEELVGLVNLLAHRAAQNAKPVVDVPDLRAINLLLDELQLSEAAKLAVAPYRAQLTRLRNHGAQASCVRDLAHCLAPLLKTSPEPPPLEPALNLAREQLQHLVNNLKLPAPLAEDKAQVQRQIARAASTQELNTCGQALVQLLQTSQGASQLDLDDLGRFLKLIAKRIEDFKSYLARSGETHTEAIDSAGSLQRLMQGQVASLLGAVDDETNFRAIKPAVINQLEGLESSLTAFVSNQHNRHGVAVTEMGQVAGRIKELEDETQRLRADLKAQRILTLIDPLTGVFNRLGYSEGIAREQARWRRYGGALSIAMCDLDLFKNINDQYGHSAGDKVLASVAELLGAQIRDCDVLCRLGGEEFAVILPETALEGAQIAAEKLRLSICNSKFRFKNEPVSVSISIGVAQFRIEDSAAEVYDRADRALYVAKSQGRNRCCSEQDIATQ